MFVKIERKGQKHARSLRKYPANKEIASICSDLKQAEDVPITVARKGRPRSERDSANAALPEVCEAPLDRIDVNTAEIINVLSNNPLESVVFAPQRMTPARIQTQSGANTTIPSQNKKNESPIRRSKRTR